MGEGLPTELGGASVGDLRRTRLGRWEVMKNGRSSLYFRRLRSFLGLDLRFRLQHCPTAERLAEGDRVAEAGLGEQTVADSWGLPDAEAVRLKECGPNYSFPSCSVATKTALRLRDAEA